MPTATETVRSFYGRSAEMPFEWQNLFAMTTNESLQVFDLLEMTALSGQNELIALLSRANGQVTDIVRNEIRIVLPKLMEQSAIQELRKNFGSIECLAAISVFFRLSQEEVSAKSNFKAENMLAGERLKSTFNMLKTALLVFLAERLAQSERELIESEQAQADVRETTEDVPELKGLRARFEPHFSTKIQTLRQQREGLKKMIGGVGQAFENLLEKKLSTTFVAATQQSLEPTEIGQEIDLVG